MTQTVDYTMRNGEVSAYCPNCGQPIGLDASEPEDVERHPAVPVDEPVTAYCQTCNTAFEVKVP